MNSKGKILKREKKNCDYGYSKNKKRGSLSFNFGEEILFGDKSDNPKQRFLEFNKLWIENPNSYLNLNNHSLPEIIRKRNKISFSSILNTGKDMANTYISFPPTPRTSKKVVAIVVPHWNSKRSKYLLSTNIVRNLFLPLSTAVYLPNYLEDDEIDYDIVGPNIGLNLYRFWQDILNLKYLTNYLRKDVGFEKVGFVSFSIGSPRVLLSTIFSDIDIDFLVMNFLADDHTEAVMKGMWTRQIAETISPHIEYEQLRDIWKLMSPGTYENYFKILPKATLLVQAKHDLVFGLDNVARIVAKLRKNAPLIEIEECDFGHTTVAEFQNGIPLMVRNARFIRKSVGLKLI